MCTGICASLLTEMDTTMQDVWVWLWLIAQYINGAIGMPYDSRDDFRLTQPFEYAIMDDGSCAQWAVYPTPYDAWRSIQNVPLAIANERTILYEDGSCENRPTN